MTLLRQARVMRGMAIAIVAAAIIDPALPRTRGVVNEVAVLSVGRVDSTLRARVEAAVPAAFAVSRRPTAATDVSVVIGATSLGERPTQGPVIVLTPPARAPSLGFTHVDHAPSVGLGTALQVRVRGRIAQATALQLRLTLQSGDVVLDALELALPARTGHFDTTLVALPGEVGPWPLRVTASTQDASAAWDLLTTVRAEPWRVLVYDARISWLSTFVRRALERDPRFVIAHRVASAPSIARTTEGAPRTLATTSALAEADVVLIGAPDALPEGEVRALERYLRAGGSVMLLVDSLGGSALPQLSGVARWRDVSGVVTMRDARGLRLTAGRVVVPVSASTELEPVMTGEGRDGLLRRGLGRGSLFISTARDAWQFRDARRSDFAALWPQRVEDAALAALGALSGELDPAVLSPGDSAQLLISTAAAASVTVALDTESVTLVPIGDRALVTVVAPLTAGLHEVVVHSAGDTLRLPLFVRPDARRDRAPDSALLRAWADATGGSTLPIDELAELGDRVRAVGASAAGTTPWYPMRSPWWILGLATLLGGEWLLRRRDGLA